MSGYSFCEHDFLICVDQSQQVLKVEVQDAPWWRYRDQIPQMTIDDDLSVFDTSVQA